MYGRLVKYHGPSLSPQYSSAWIMYAWHPIRTTPTFDNARVDFRVQPQPFGGKLCALGAEVWDPTILWGLAEPLAMLKTPE